MGRSSCDGDGRAANDVVRLPTTTIWSVHILDEGLAPLLRKRFGKTRPRGPQTRFESAIFTPGPLASIMQSDGHARHVVPL